MAKSNKKRRGSSEQKRSSSSTRGSSGKGSGSSSNTEWWRGYNAATQTGTRSGSSGRSSSGSRSTSGRSSGGNTGGSARTQSRPAQPSRGSGISTSFDQWQKNRQQAANQAAKQRYGTLSDSQRRTLAASVYKNVDKDALWQQADEQKRQMQSGLQELQSGGRDTADFRRQLYDYERTMRQVNSWYNTVIWDDELYDSTKRDLQAMQDSYDQMFGAYKGLRDDYNRQYQGETGRRQNEAPDVNRLLEDTLPGGGIVTDFHNEKSIYSVGDRVKDLMQTNSRQDRGLQLAKQTGQVLQETGLYDPQAHTAADISGMPDQQRKDLYRAVQQEAISRSKPAGQQVQDQLKTYERNRDEAARRMNALADGRTQLEQREYQQAKADYDKWDSLINQGAAERYSAIGQTLTQAIEGSDVLSELYGNTVAAEEKIDQLSQTIERLRGGAVQQGDGNREQIQRVQQQLEQAQRQRQALVEQLDRLGIPYDRARQYVRWNERKTAAEQEQQSAYEMGQEHVGAAVAGQLVGGAVKGVDFVTATLGSLGHNDPMDPETYVPQTAADYPITGYTNSLQEGATDKIREEYGDVAAFLYNTGMSTVQSAELVAMLGPAASYLMGANAAGDQALSIVERGGSNRQAFWGGLAAGAAEVLAEKFSIEKLLEPKTVTNFRGVLRETLKQAGTEASEEAVTEIANILSDAAIMGENSETALRVQKYMAKDGMTKEKAQWRAFLDNIGQVALSAAGGAISGGVMGGAVSLANYAGLRSGPVDQSRENVEADTTSQVQTETSTAGNEAAEAARNAQQRQQAGALEQTMQEQGYDRESRVVAQRAQQLQEQNEASFARQWDAARSYGREGVSLEYAKGSRAVEGLSEVAVEAAWADGQRAARDGWTQEERRLGAEGRKQLQALQQQADGQQNAAQLREEFAQSYQAGLTGAKLEQRTALSQTQQQAAWNAGKADSAATLQQGRQNVQQATTAQDSGLVYDQYVLQAMQQGSATHESGAQLTRETAKQMDTLSKSLGVRVQFVDQVAGGSANAAITGSTIRIERGNPHPVRFLLGHELTHRIQELAPDEYRVFRDAVAQERSSEVTASLALYERQGMQQSYEGAMDEAAADYAGRLMEGGRTLDDFITRNQGNRTLLQRVRDAIRSFVGKLTGAEKRQAQTAEEKLTQALRAAQRQAKDLQNQQTDGTMQETRYSAKRKYWRPKLTQSEWALLNRRMEQEIADPAHALDDATQWAYANEKGNQVFALYGIGDGTEATPLYVSSGKTATADYRAFAEYREELKHGADRSAEAFSRMFEAFRREHGKVNGSLPAAQGRSAATGYGRVSSERGRNNGRKGAGRSLQDSGNVGTRFSLKAPVEETKNLIALHNVNEDGLLGALKLGGLPSPSIAITKADMGHSKYGDISLVFSKDTVDPQFFRSNKVYGSDAWTPTAPAVEYPVVSKRLTAVEREIHKLSGSTAVAGGIFGNSSALRSMGVDDISTKSPAELAKVLAGTDTARAAYLADQGKTLEPVKKAKQWDKYGNDTLQSVIDEIGVQRLAEIQANLELGEGVMAALGSDADTVKGILRSYYQKSGEAFLRKHAVKKKWTAEQIAEARQTRVDRAMENNVSNFTLEDVVRHAWQMYEDGGATKGEIDRGVTSDALRAAVNDSDVAAWAAEKLDGLFGEPGIYNGKDRYTASGNTRSFKQTHYDYTLDNIVKAMNENQQAKGEGIWGASAESLMAVAAPEYANIDEIRADKGRLRTASEEEFNRIKDSMREQIDQVIAGIRKNNRAMTDNQFEEIDHIGSALIDGAKGKQTAAAIRKAFREYGYTVADNLIAPIQQLYKAAAATPTEYFEAKPQRAVGFDEVLAAVVPDNAGTALKQGLSDKGVTVIPYEAGNEADRLAKINEVEDAKFSRKGTSIDKEYEALLRERDALKERVNYWRGQTKRTASATTDRNAVARSARELISNYGAQLQTEEIRPGLQRLYDFMASGKDGRDELTYEAVRERAEGIAQKIANSAVAQEDELYRSYKDLRDYLRGTKLTISEADGRDIPDFGDFRKRNFGRMNVSRGEGNIDTVYQELQQQWPEFFDEAQYSTPSDQLQQISEVLDRVYTIAEGNPFSGYSSQAVAGIANEIMDNFFELPQTRATFADQQAQKLDAAKAKGKEQLQRARQQTREQKQELTRQRREAVQQAILGEKMAAGKQLEKLKREYQAKGKEQRDTQQRRELAAKITRHAKALSKKLLRPTDAQHIPQELRTVVAQALESINQSSGRDYDQNLAGEAATKRTQAWDALAEQYRQAAQDDSVGLVVDPALLSTDETGRTLFQRVRDAALTPVDRRTQAQLADTWKLLRVLETSISKAGKTLSRTKFESTQRWASALEADTATRIGRTRNIAYDMETPYTFFSRYGQAGMEIYRMLRNAQDQRQLYSTELNRQVQEIVTPKQAQQWQRERHQFTTERGQTLELNTAQLMELRELMARPQAAEHILRGGVMQPELRQDGKRVARGTEAVLLSEADIDAMLRELTPEQVQAADKLQALTTGALAQWGNQASMAAYGYEKFADKHYWPIRAATEEVHSRTEHIETNARSIKNIGLAQAVQPHASNAVELPGLFDTFARHSADMMDYAAWLLPMEDANRLFNYQYRDALGNRTGRTVKGMLDRYGGSGAQKYWNRLMANIQNGLASPQDSEWAQAAQRVIGNAKGAAVGGNIRVVIQQPTAFLRANAVLNPGDLAAGLVKGVTRGNGWQKALQWAPIAQIKDAGSFDIGSARSMQTELFGGGTKLERFNEAMGWGAGKADAVTWGKLWNACEHEVARTQKNLTPGSDAFYRRVAQRFTETIDATQVVDGVLQRSQMMRSRNMLNKMATAFMGEPTMSMNLLMRTAESYLYENNKSKRAKALKQVGRAATALLVTDVVNALAQSLIDAVRDDDRDKDYWQRYWAALTGQSGDEKNLWEKTKSFLGSNVFSNMDPVERIPYAKDALTIWQGYDVTRADADVIADVVNAVKTAQASFSGSGAKTRGYALEQLAKNVGKLFGVSAGNLLRDAYAFARSMAQASGSIPLQYELEKVIYSYTSEKNANRYMDILYDAGKQTDPSDYDHIRHELLSGGAVDEDKLKTGMVSRIQSDYEDGNITRERAAALLQQLAGLDTGEAEHKLSGWELKQEQGFNRSEMKQRYLSGQMERDQAIQLQMEYNGKTRQEAEEAVLGWDVEDVKQDYDDGAANEAQAVKRLQVLGYDTDEAEAKVLGWQKVNETGSSNIWADYADGKIDRQDAIDWRVKYDGKTRQEAEAEAAAKDFKLDNPEYEEYSDTQIGKYLDLQKRSRIDANVYFDFYDALRGMESKKDANGKAIDGQSKKDQGMAYIDRLPLSRSQKDALYLTQWKESTIGEAPWH